MTIRALIADNVGELPFPRLGERKMEALEATLDYPPRGSVQATDPLSRDAKSGRLKEPPKQPEIDQP